MHLLTLISYSTHPHILTFSPLHTPPHCPQLVSYAVLRNLSGFLQSYTSSLLSQLGSPSLWLFVSSHHILLALNSSALLLLFPNKSHLLNFILVLSVFLCAHLVVTTAANTIRQYKTCGHKSPVTARHALINHLCNLVTYTYVVIIKLMEVKFVYKLY